MKRHVPPGLWPAFAVIAAVLLTVPMANATSAWPMQMGNAERSGASGTLSGPGTGTVVWQAEVPFNIQAPPANAGKHLLVGYGEWDGQGGLVSFSSDTGSVDWQVQTDPVHMSPVIAGNVVVVTTARPDHEDARNSRVSLLGLELATGRELWKREFAQTSAISPTIADNSVYLPTGHFHDATPMIHALDLRTGDERWSIEARGNSLLTVGSTVVVSGLSNVHAIDASNGQFMWSTQLVGAGYVEAGSAFDGVLVIPTEEQGVFGIDLSSGGILWNLNTHVGAGATAAIAEGLAFVGTPNGVKAIDIKTGVVHHSLPVTTFAGIAVHEDVAYMVEYAGALTQEFDARQFYIVAMNASTGEEHWRHHLARFTYTSPIIADGILYQAYGDWDQPAGIVALDAGFLAEGKQTIASGESTHADNDRSVPTSLASAFIAVIALGWSTRRRIQ